jgi:polyisoprenoid-binding protein YceI
MTGALALLLALAAAAGDPAASVAGSPAGGVTDHFAAAAAGDLAPNVSPTGGGTAGPASAGADSPAAAVAGTWDSADGSTLTFHVVHKFHAVTGVARGVEARARLAPDGGLQVSVRARVAGFDSGNSNRDAHMLEVLEAARFPFVTVKGVAEGIRLDAVPGEVDVPLRGALELHGVSRPLDVTAHVRFTSPDRAEVEATFPLSLDAHRVERPSLLFVKIDDRVEITARLVLVRTPP